MIWLQRLQFIILAGTASYLSLTPHVGKVFFRFWDKLLHASCWFVLYLSLQLAMKKNHRILKPATCLFLYSVLIEFLQKYSGRQFSVRDIAANAVGIALGAAVFTAAEWLLHFFKRKVRDRQIINCSR